MKAYLQQEVKKNPYKHYFPAAPDDPSFPTQYSLELVDTEELFGEMCQKAMAFGDKLIMAVDTETSDLNHEVCRVVGASLCFEPTTAYYLPFGHRIGVNLPERVIRFFIKLLYRAKKNIMANARFDIRILEKLGADRHLLNHYDVLQVLWLADSNKPMPGLKWGAKHFLGWDMTTYDEALGGATDLSFNTPDEAAPYACADALGTWHLARRIDFLRKRHPFIVDLDNEMLLPVAIMEETPTPIDKVRIAEARTQAAHRLAELEEEIYRDFDKVFNINSGPQIAHLLMAHNIDTGKRTEKTKKMKIGADELEPISHLHPGIVRIVEYKKLTKFMGSYCNPLMEQYNDKIKGIRFAYQTTTTPTGRLAAKGEKKNSFFASNLNVQAIDKPSSMMYKAEKCEEDHPEGIKGWLFTPKDECPDWEGPWVEGMSPKRNVRRGFRAYPDHLWVHYDYMTQELRIPANLAKERVWIDAFLRKEDLHRKMAALIWGELEASKRRKDAKGLNFGALYGGSKFTFAKSLGCSPEEAQEILDDWWGVLKQLTTWVRTSEAKAKIQGTIETFFGRPRRVKWYFEQPGWGMQAFARRTAVNTQVQGAGADVVKIGMCNVYREILKHRSNKGRIKLLNCIHDELNFSVLNREPFFKSALMKIQDLMQFHIPGWEVPMLVDLAIGDSWGSMFPFHLDRETMELTPQYD